MVIIETQTFTKRIKKLMTDEEYQKLQNTLINTPDAGNIIKGSGGIRKIRWVGIGRGKKGGSRLIYYWAKSINQIFMLFVYAKNEYDDLTVDQISILRNVVEVEFGNEK